MPAFRNSDHPDRNECLNMVRGIAGGLPSKDLILVGHSLGVATALDYIETLSEPACGLASVSGFADDYGAELNSYFMREKRIDLEKVKANTRQRAVFYGDNDPYVPRAYLSSLADALGVTPVVIPAGGHLNTDAGFTTFPALLKTVRTFQP